jgi:hypothetical protein
MEYVHSENTQHLYCPVLLLFSDLRQVLFLNHLCTSQQGIVGKEQEYPHIRQKEDHWHGEVMMDEQSVARRRDQSVIRRQENTQLPTPVVQPPIQPPPIIYPVSVPTHQGIPQWVWGVGIVLLQSLLGILLLIGSDVWWVIGYSFAMHAVVALPFLVVQSRRSRFVLFSLIPFSLAYYPTFWFTVWLGKQIL